MDRWKKTRKKANPRSLPTWNYESRRLLWMIRISDDDLILVEERDTDARTVEFACVRCDDGRVMWSGLHFDEPWWISLAGIYDGIAYFHGYRRPDTPAPLGIHAIDMQTGRLLWHNTDHIFEFAVGSDVFASQPSFSGRRWFIFHAADGSLTKDLGLDDSRIRTLRDELNAVDAFRDYRYPMHFDASHPDHGAIGPVMTQLVDITQVNGQLDVLVVGGLVVAAWHEQAVQSHGDNPSLDQYMIIADKTSGELLYADQLNTNLPAPAADSFFLRKRHIIHLKDGRVLKAHTLPDGTQS